MQTMVIPITTLIPPDHNGFINISTSTDYDKINEHGRFDNSKNLQRDSSYIEIGDIIIGS